MSRRKKLNGYNPKQQARDNIIRQMRGINNTEQLFIQESRLMAENLDSEREALAAISNEQLRTYLLGRLDIVNSGYAGLLQEFLRKIAALRTPADKVATEMMDRLSAEKWDTLRDTVQVVDLQLEGFVTEALLLGQEAMASGIDLFTDYTARYAAVKRGLKANATAEEILAKMTELDEELAAQRLANDEDAVDAESGTEVAEESVTEEPNHV